ncbi:MAG: efflux RND transporter permease subunit [Candidatus Kaelpia aquatica]|nr:efflux RND transporter permease subunit [Candidatus Kaelpia aquatica]
MNLPSFSVKRPVTVTMFFLGIMLLGAISWVRLPQELYPSISYPQISVVTTYENASPEEIETLVTKIIEEAVGTVNGLKKISSISKEGLSLIILDFDWGTHMDFASLGVREKIDLVKERLPMGAKDPIVMKFNPFETPIAILSIKGSLPSRELRELVRKEIKDELEKIDGVASAAIVGGREREILVALDQGKLYANRIPILKVAESIKQTNFTFPAGTIKEKFYEYLIRTMGEFEAVKEIENVVVEVQDVDPPKTQYEEYIRESKGESSDKRIIHLGDLGIVQDSLKDLTNLSRYNGSDNIALRIQRQAGANIITVVKAVEKKLLAIEERLQGRVEIEIVYDQSKFIQDSINGVRDAAVQGGVLAFIVLFFFLMNIYSSLIVALSIPISIMFAFSLMYFRGLSINIMSLGGLALGVGMLVDNAIVVIENIIRKRQLGGPAKEAAIDGTSEVAAAIFSSTLTTIAVFLPLIFVQGVAGQLFKELAFTVIFALIASLAVALSLIPSLASKIKRVNKERKEWVWMKILRISYANTLKSFLRFKQIGFALVIAVTGLSLYLLTKIDRELMPKVDQREFMIMVDMPTGTKIEVTDRVIKRIERTIFKYPDIKGVSVTIGSSKEKDYGGSVETLGSHQSQIVINLKEFPKKSPYYRKSQDIVQQLQKDLLVVDLERAELAYILQETIFKAAMGGGKPVNVEIRGRDLDVLRSTSESLVLSLSDIAGLYDIKSDLMPPQPEVKINIMKQKAALYNLSVNTISLATNAAIRGYVASKYKEEGREYDIRTRLRDEDREDLSKIRRILIHSPLGVEIPLADVAYLVRGVGPSEIKRLGQERTVLVSANVYKRSFNEIANSVDSKISNMDIPEDYVVQLSGERKEMEESFKSLFFALLLSIILVYMIMAAQFESFWQPFVIIFSVPLAAIGITVALLLTHTTLNIVVFLGVIILGGIVVNNGIVLIDHINGLREEGFSTYEAVLEASQNRLRPILMTALTTTLGLMPLALGFSDGAELRAPMAIAVIGGLSSSTLLTLFIIPALYIVAVKMLEGRGKQILPQVEQGLVSSPEPRQQEQPDVVGTKLEREEDAVIKEDREKKAQYLDLNQRQIEALEHLRQQGRLRRQEYVQMFNVSIATAARDLKDLQKKKIITPEGPSGPGRWYRMT